MDRVKNYNLIRLEFFMKVDYSPQTSKAFLDQEKHFKEANIRDVEYDY